MYNHDCFYFPLLYTNILIILIIHDYILLLHDNLCLVITIPIYP